MSMSFTFRAKHELSDEIHATAEAHGLSVSAIIREAIRTGLERKQDGGQRSAQPRPAESEPRAGGDFRTST